MNLSVLRLPVLRLYSSVGWPRADCVNVALTTARTQRYSHNFPESIAIIIGYTPLRGKCFYLAGHDFVVKGPMNFILFHKLNIAYPF